jgi:hypothetical protein
MEVSSDSESKTQQRIGNLAYLPRWNGVLREELSEDAAEVAAVQGALSADVPPAAGPGLQEHPDVRLGRVPDVHVRVRLVDVRLGLAGEVLEYVQGAGVHGGLQQLAEHHHRDDHRQVQPPCPRRLPRAPLRDRLRVAVPVLRIPRRQVRIPQTNLGVKKNRILLPWCSCSTRGRSSWIRQGARRGRGAGSCTWCRWWRTARRAARRRRRRPRRRSASRR